MMAGQTSLERRRGCWRHNAFWKLSLAGGGSLCRRITFESSDVEPLQVFHFFLTKKCLLNGVICFFFFRFLSDHRHFSHDSSPLCMPLSFISGVTFVSP